MDLKSEWLVEDRKQSALWRIHEATYEWANGFIAGDDRVLDYGCGSGYGTAMLSGKAVGVDISEEAIEYARQHHKGVEFRLISGPLPFSDNSFDVVCSFQVIEHVDAAGYLTEAVRVLSSRGVMLIVTPPREQRLYSWQRPWNPYHLTELTAPELVELIGEHFDAVDYVPMTADGHLAASQLSRWRANRIRSIPFTIPIGPDRWRRTVIKWISEHVPRGDLGGSPDGTIRFGSSEGTLMNHCIVATAPKS